MLQNFQYTKGLTNLNNESKLMSPEGGTDVMVLQDCSIIVQEGCFSARHDMEVVGCASVLVVMDNGCHQSGKDLQVCQPVLTVQRETHTHTHVHPSQN